MLLHELAASWHGAGGCISEYRPMPCCLAGEDVSALQSCGAACVHHNVMCLECEVHCCDWGIVYRRHIRFMIGRHYDWDTRPEWLIPAQDDFIATLAAAAMTRRQALLMSIHPRCKPSLLPCQESPTDAQMMLSRPWLCNGCATQTPLHVVLRPA
jgi:hypothetical protein